ncbi:MAG: hypothetical protein JXQ27_01995 [Acidobacteria bacterium]|nr:hypothetical protein [Acidobacteriota bacterium]
MDAATIVAYVLLFTGLLDVVVIPRILLTMWRRRGEDFQNQQIQVIRILRYGGSVLILIGALIYLKIIDF